MMHQYIHSYSVPYLRYCGYRSHTSNTTTMLLLRGFVLVNLLSFALTVPHSNKHKGNAVAGRAFHEAPTCEGGLASGGWSDGTGEGGVNSIGEEGVWLNAKPQLPDESWPGVLRPPKQIWPSKSWPGNSQPSHKTWPSESWLANLSLSRRHSHRTDEHRTIPGRRGR